MQKNKDWIIIKTPEQINNLRISWKLLTEMLLLLRDATKPWVTLIELENMSRDFCKKHNVTGAFLGNQWYKYNLCLSVNDCVVHGIPDNYELKAWDLLKIDAGINYKKALSDAAIAIVVWWDETNPEATHLKNTTKQALDAGVKTLWPGKPLYNYWFTVEKIVKQNNCSIIGNVTGHGVGTALWEPPYIYNYAHPSLQRIFLEPGMVIALEPITAIESRSYKEKPHIKWNLYTQKGDLGAQREYSVLITENGYEILAGVQ